MLLISGEYTGLTTNLTAWKHRITLGWKGTYWQQSKTNLL